MTLPTTTSFLFRTEDIPLEDIPKLFVETERDREIIEKLKSRSPVILVGSRGVGKSFLLRMAEHELHSTYASERILPVYTTFNRSSLLVTKDALQFQHYMLARICSRTLRALSQHGAIASSSSSVSILGGGLNAVDPTKRMDEISRLYEQSFRAPGGEVDYAGLPNVEDFKDAIEEICKSAGIARIVLLMDEAAHVFRPEQQRQFFTLFRDLRGPYISCNAAVYPGVTSFGDVFQPAHDAEFVTVDRDVLANNYVQQMRDIVEKQASSTISANIERQGQNFAALAYAATGNPRLLLKTVARAEKVSHSQVNEIIKEFYRQEIWTEHSTLPQNYPGHRELIDWGRRFIESVVLTEIKKRNDVSLAQASETTAFFWVHRDAPEVIREALRLLEYTGIVREHTKGIRATRNEIGTRYGVNLGCLFALETVPRDTGHKISKRLSARRFVEYGTTHPAFQELVRIVPRLIETDPAQALARQFAQSVDILDITPWQRGELKKIGLQTVGDVLAADETGLKQIKYVKEKRARRIFNAAIAAVLEYLSG